MPRNFSRTFLPTISEVRIVERSLSGKSLGKSIEFLVGVIPKNVEEGHDHREDNRNRKIIVELQKTWPRFDDGDTE